MDLSVLQIEGVPNMPGVKNPSWMEPESVSHLYIYIGDVLGLEKKNTGFVWRSSLLSGGKQEDLEKYTV